MSIGKIAAVLTRLARAGVPGDVQELLVHGDPTRGIPPGALQKALLPLLSDKGWEPIETAPKDGGPILGFQATPGDHENRISVCWRLGGVVWIGDGGLMPTHWQPLPLPPLPLKESTDV